MSRAGQLAALAVLSLLSALLILDLSGHRLLVVAGSSMEPAIPRGALLLARATPPEALVPGDVVAFEHEGRSVAHRIEAVVGGADRPAFRTRGDANAAADPAVVSFHGEAGLVTVAVPIAGYALALLRWSAPFVALALAAYFALAALGAARRGSFLPARP